MRKIILLNTAIILQVKYSEIDIVLNKLIAIGLDSIGML
jgi:hypothetical protein